MTNKLMNTLKRRVNKLRKTKKNMVNSLTSQIYTANSKYVDVSLIINSDKETMKINVNYKDLNGVSAIHIHNNNNGKPGQIIGWLGTSKEWQQGVLQNTPGKNCPCCNINNPLCILAAPKGTPNIKSLSKRNKSLSNKNKSINKTCPWIKNGAFLVIHGNNFQRVSNGKLTNEKPGLDILEAIPFTK